MHTEDLLPLSVSQSNLCERCPFKIKVVTQNEAGDFLLTSFCHQAGHAMSDMRNVAAGLPASGEIYESQKPEPATSPDAEPVAKDPFKLIPITQCVLKDVVMQLRNGGVLTWARFDSRDDDYEMTHNIRMWSARARGLNIFMQPFFHSTIISSRV